MAERPFVVFKFLNEDDDEVVYEVGLDSWLIDLEDDMHGKIRWPPAGINAGQLVRREAAADPTWKVFPVLVKRFYDTFINANTGCNKRIEDTNYETDHDAGRGKRIKRKPHQLDYSDESGDDDRDDDSEDEGPSTSKKSKKTKKHVKAVKSKSKKKTVPPPPPLQLNPNAPGRYVASPGKLKQQNSFNITITKTQSASSVSKLKEMKGKQREEHTSKKNKNKPQFSFHQQSKDQEKVLGKSKEKNEEDAPLKTLQEKLSEYKTARALKQNKSKTLGAEELEEQKVDDVDYRSEVADKVKSSSVGLEENEIHVESFEVHDNIDSTEGNQEGLQPNTEKAAFEKCETSFTPKRKNKEKVFLSSSKTLPVVSSDEKSVSPIPSSFKLRRFSPITTASSAKKQLLFGSEDNGTNMENGALDKSMNTTSDKSLMGLMNSIINALNENKAEVRKVSSKVDILSMNQERLCRHILPGEKVIKRPSALPPFPVQTLSDLKIMEKFLSDENNLSASATYMARFISVKDFHKSVRTLMNKLVGKDVAKKYTFYGVGDCKMKFECLKIWDLILGALLTVFEGDILSEAPAIAGRWLTLSSYSKKSEISTGARKKVTSPKKPLK